MSSAQVTPQQHSVPVQQEAYAPRISRLVAAFIDGMIMMVITIPAALSMQATLGLPWLLYSIACGFIGFGAFTAVNYKLLAEGQTVGKKIMGLRIVSRDGKPVSANDLVAKRYAPMYLMTSVPFVGSLVAIANAVLIFRSNHGCGHDEIASTKVVNA